MHEILFKGLYQGEWVEGFLLREQNYFGDVIAKICQIRGPALYHKYIVEPETVCQYIGLIDKNNEKIFENSLIRVNGRGIFRVAFLDTSACYVAIGHNEMLTFQDLDSGSMEVVGDVFKNPELWKTI